MSSQESLADLLSDLEARLHPYTDTPRLDAQVLIAHVTGKPRSWILAHPEAHLAPDQLESYTQASTRLEHGEPLPYILGHREFYGLDFLVTPQVLIPRPETELLVEHALDWLRRHPERRWATDIGTGSGCIAVTLAASIPDLRLQASDISHSALEVALLNAQKHHVANRIEFIQADLLDFPHHKPFDLLCANLPYIPSASLPALSVSDWEPSLALDGGIEGLDLIHRLLVQARPHLAPEALMLLEIESTKRLSVLSLAQKLLPGSISQVYQDLSGCDRLLAIFSN
jgi:release factor glutamine methyltransferase